jgi:hypothetical protein
MRMRENIPMNCHPNNEASPQTLREHIKIQVGKILLFEKNNSDRIILNLFYFY